jgi:hypothetical protein
MRHCRHEGHPRLRCARFPGTILSVNEHTHQRNAQPRTSTLPLESPRVSGRVSAQLGCRASPWYLISCREVLVLAL